jgi:hypothetical protein
MNTSLRESPGFDVGSALQAAAASDSLEAMCVALGIHPKPENRDLFCRHPGPEMLLSMQQRNHDALQRHAELLNNQPALPPPSNHTPLNLPHSLAIMRDWSQFYSPAEMLSVNASCSVFSPGRNWPGNVRFDFSSPCCR